MQRKAKLTGAARVGRRIKLKLPTFAQSKRQALVPLVRQRQAHQEADQASLKLTKAYKGKRITVTVTATRTGYTTLTLTVRPSGKVKSRKS